MLFNSLIASSILAFVAAVPAPAAEPQNIDWKTVSYNVDWKTVDYSGIDWKTVSYDFSNVDWKTVNYGGATPVPTTARATSTAKASPTSSAAQTSATAAPVGPYSFVTARSGSPVHLLPIYPAGTLQIGSSSSPFSYTPPSVAAAGVSVPVTQAAQFNVGQGTAGLDVGVPGGQQLYVKSDGTIGYTQPHSGSIPSGASTREFSIQKGTGTDQLLFNGKAQFLACPLSGKSGQYEITVAEKTTRTDCTGVGIVGAITSGVAAYQWQ